MSCPARRSPPRRLSPVFEAEPLVLHMAPIDSKCHWTASYGGPAWHTKQQHGEGGHSIDRQMLGRQGPRRTRHGPLVGMDERLEVFCHRGRPAGQPFVAAVAAPLLRGSRMWYAWRSAKLIRRLPWTETRIWWACVLLSSAHLVRLRPRTPELVHDVPQHDGIVLSVWQALFKGVSPA